MSYVDFIFTKIGTSGELFYVYIFRFENGYLLTDLYSAKIYEFLKFLEFLILRIYKIKSKKLIENLKLFVTWIQNMYMSISLITDGLFYENSNDLKYSFSS